MKLTTAQQTALQVTFTLGAARCSNATSYERGTVSERAATRLEQAGYVLIADPHGVRDCRRVVTVTPEGQRALENRS